MIRGGRADADEAHAERMKQAALDLEGWGRWVMQRTDGGLGYGNSVLANLERVSQSATGYQAPINEVHCSWVDDAVQSLHPIVRTQARLHFGGRFSYRFIARQHRTAIQTVSRNIEMTIRTVAYWKVSAPIKRGSYAM
jgi:hypothetical protein